MLDAVNLLSSESDYGEMRDATLAVVGDNFGLCSDEGTAVIRAWNQICMPTSECGFSIVGDFEVCEEDDNMTLCITGGLAGATYRWQFPINWTVDGNPIGNTVEGSCLVVTDFPKYDWYARYFQVNVTLLGTGEERTANVSLLDCLGDDPTCEEYYSVGENSTEDKILTTEIVLHSHFKKAETLRVFDVLGRQLYSGPISSFQKDTESYSGIVILLYFDKTDAFVKAEKVYW